jgi:dynein heavy chain
MDWDTVVPHDRLIFGDFMFPDVDNKIYEEIESMDKLKSVVEEYLSDHNAESKQPMPLVMFSDALEHVARIARVIRQPQGNALLLGVGGSGRQSMTKLATYIVGFQLATVEIVKGYTMSDWREDLKRILMMAGVKDKPTTFLYSDVQIINERMVEDINNILNSGDVPNLYANEDMEAISSACRIECQKRKIPPTKLNIFSQKLTITGTTTENILNTPYFHNQLYSDFGKSGSAYGRYAGSAYLLLNSLPFVELQDYVNFKNGDYEKQV